MAVASSTPAASLISPFVPAGGALLLLLAAGLLLWALGGRLLRPGLALIGLIAGLPVGIWIGVAVAPEVPSVLFAAGGALAGLVIASISYGLALASVTAVLGGVLGLLGAWTAAEAGLIDSSRAAAQVEAASGAIVEQASPTSRETLSSLWFAARGTTTHGASNAPASGASADEAGDHQGAPLSDHPGVVARLRAAVESLWASLPQPLRTLLVAALAAGVVIGALFGLLFADAAAKLVTSMAGSVILLIAGIPLISALMGRTDDLLPPRPGAWFAAIALLTIVGFGVQRAIGTAPRDGRERDRDRA